LFKRQPDIRTHPVENLDPDPPSDSREPVLKDNRTMTSKYQIVDIHEEGIEEIQLTEMLYKIEKEYLPPLHERVDIREYGHKIYSKSKIAVVVERPRPDLLGFISFYCNDYKNREAYISILWVDEKLRGSGVGRRLFIHCFEYLKKMNFKNVRLQTWSTHRLLPFYYRLGFQEVQRVADRPMNNASVHLLRKLL
jgi:[ribosomal protein S18]-alanine N-acetyltransferase